MARGRKPFKAPPGYITVSEAAERMGVTRRYVLDLLEKHGNLLGFKRGDDRREPWMINPVALCWVRSGLPIKGWHIDAQMVDAFKAMGELAGPAVCAARFKDTRGLVMIGMVLSVALLRLKGQRLADDELAQMIIFIQSMQNSESAPVTEMLDDSETLITDPDLTGVCRAFERELQAQLKQLQTDLDRAQALYDRKSKEAAQVSPA